MTVLCLIHVEGNDYGTQQTVKYIWCFIGAVFIGCGGITVAVERLTMSLKEMLLVTNRDVEVVQEKDESTEVSTDGSVEDGANKKEIVLPEDSNYELVFVNNHTLAKLNGSPFENYYCPYCFEGVKESAIKMF